MRKMKTHKGAAKRFRATGSGKFLRGNAFRSHILEKKSPKRKRQMRGLEVVHDNDAKRVSRLLPYA